LKGPRATTLAVVGAGWAGLAAAVRAVEQGYRVTLYDMAARPGGRAREVMHGDVPLDNGQHILIGAYRETLALMRTVGADPDALFDRRPLALVDPHGHGLALSAGPPVLAFVRAVVALRSWSLSERAALLAAALRWRLAGFSAPESQSVAGLTSDLPRRVRAELIDPLCVAALNTPSERASAQIFLRVLRDALFSGPGAADLLLPRVPLSALLPTPASRWLQQQGATLRWTARVQQIEPAPDTRWRVDGESFDTVLLACSAHEAARLARPVAARWAETAAAFDYEPIITVYLRSPGERLPSPMVALHAGPDAPAQFAFDLGALDPSGARGGLFAFVISGAKAWVEAGLDVAALATLRQAQGAFASIRWQAVRAIAERRATFLCTPGLARPVTQIAPAFAAAGDYIVGPYPATLEGAVRSALKALDALGLRNP